MLARLQLVILVVFTSLPVSLHLSNEEETLKLTDTVIYPYVVKKRAEAGLPEDQNTLIVWNVFKGQTMDKVKYKLATLNFELVAVPTNMTHFFQPLNPTVNDTPCNLANSSLQLYDIQEG